MKEVLIAFDGTEGAELAVTDLLRASPPQNVGAKVLTIADVWLPASPPTSTDIIPSDLDEKLAQAHAKAAESLREARVTAIRGAQLVHQQFPLWTVTNAAKADSPAWGIIAEARRWAADLIVVGSHGRTPLERFFVGSVSYKVAAEAVCSVRVAKPHSSSGARHPRVLVGVDGSGDARHAVEEVISRLWRAGTEIHFVTVIDPKLRSIVLGRRDFLEQHGNMDRVEDWIEPLFDLIRARCNEKELTAHFHIFEGDPKHKLLAYAAEKNVDTIFLGARGLDHGERLYLGTVASAVCTRAHCTVEIVRSLSR